MARGCVAGLACVAMIMAVCGSALAEPRDSATVANLPSDVVGPFSVGTSFFITQTAPYTTRYVRVQGTLNRVNANAQASSAGLDFLYGSDAAAPRFFVRPMTTQSFNGGVGGGTVSVDTFQPLPVAVTGNVAGQWIITSFTSFDLSGVDSMWSTLTVTLNDGPPTQVIDLGDIATGSLHYTPPIFAGQPVWFRFHLTMPLDAVLGQYLDIDTEGSNVGAGLANDLEIALFDENGVMVGYDDDDGNGRMSQLTYGLAAPARPPVGASEPYNGRDGAHLDPGTYYLGVCGYGPSLHGIGWQFNNAASTRSGFAKVNIRAVTQPATFCAPDYNHDGGLSSQDIFDFLNEWFSGCP